jgi:hypothetical protein
MDPVGNATPGRRRASRPAPPRAGFAGVARMLQVVAESLSEAAGPRAGRPGAATVRPGGTARTAARGRFGRGGRVDLLALAAYLPQR